MNQEQLDHLTAVLALCGCGNDRKHREAIAKAMIQAAREAQVADCSDAERCS